VVERRREVVEQRREVVEQREVVERPRVVVKPWPAISSGGGRIPLAPHSPRDPNPS
jgi:hypothetical protein